MRRWYARALYLYYILLCVLGLGSCAVVRVTRPVVKVGLVGPFEGQYRYVGYDAIYAARLALREANAAGGVGSYHVELVAYDDQGTVQGARQAAQNLIQDPQVVAVIGHFRDATSAAAQPIYERSGLPLHVAGTVAGDPALLCPLLEYLTEKGAGPIGWLGALSDLPPCAADAPPTPVETFPPAPDVSAVLLTGDPINAGENLRALRASGWDGPVAGGPALGSPLFREMSGASASGALFVAPYRWPETDGQDAAFSAAYQALGPHVPPPGPFALSTYQATQTLLAAVAATGEREAPLIRQALSVDPPADYPVYLYRWGDSDTPILLQTLD